MKNKIIIFIILTAIISGFSFFDFGYNRINFDNEGFSYDLNIGLKSDIDYYFLIKDTYSYKYLFLNSKQEKYTTNATSLFDKNVESNLDTRFAINYNLDLAFIGDKFRKNYDGGLNLTLKNEVLLKTFEEFEGINHSLTIDSYINRNTHSKFKENYETLKVSLTQGLAYDFNDYWNYTKLKTHLEYNKEFNGLYIRPESNFEIVLLESNPEKEYYLPRINLKNSTYNLAVNNYIKNNFEIGYAIDSEYYFPMKTRIGIFGETLFYSDKLQDLFTDKLNGFAGINLTHMIFEESIGSCFFFEAGVGKHFTRNSISEGFTPYFKIQFNWQFSIALIAGIMGPLIVK